ncbi:KEOPS complex subunit Pcc1 [Thermogladius sp. 4427co]|uniref:KEOPS complex subunit Pcc1 n=1 Tax=Thermogladius sp. 4427co TaxID=3450718 RepID=UPI003F79970E
MEVSLRVEIRLDPRLARAVFESLRPDNEYPGPDLEIRDCIREEESGAVYVLEAVCVSKATCINTVRGTLDEVLSLIDMITRIRALTV